MYMCLTSSPLIVALGKLGKIRADQGFGNFSIAKLILNSTLGFKGIHDESRRLWRTAIRLTTSRLVVFPQWDLAS